MFGKRHNYRTKRLSIILLVIIFILINITQGTLAQIEKPVTFYLYNPVEMEKNIPIYLSEINYSKYGELSTIPPDFKKENYTYCPMDIENFTGSHEVIGRWFSEMIYYPINTTLDLKFNVWVKSITNITNVSFSVELLIPVYNDSSGFAYYSGHSYVTANQNLSNHSKPFSISHNSNDKVQLRNGGRLSLVLAWNYTPSENSSADNVTIISFSDNMQSSLQLSLDSITTEIKEYFIDKSKNTIKIKSKISDALGLTDIKQYSISIINPIENVTLSEHIIDRNEFEIISNWSWYYGSEGAKSGNYTFILTVIDNSNNTWEDSITVFLEVYEEKDKDDNIFAFWITPIAILLIILILYFALRLRKSKNKIE